MNDVAFESAGLGAGSEDTAVDGGSGGVGLNMGHSIAEGGDAIDTHCLGLSGHNHVARLPEVGTQHSVVGGGRVSVVPITAVV